MRIEFTEKIEEIGKKEIELSDGTRVDAVPDKPFDAPDSDAEGLIEQGYARETEETAAIEEIIREEPGISPNQNKKLHAVYNELDWGEKEKRNYLEKFSAEHTNELNRSEAAVAIEELSDRAEKREVVTRTETGKALVEKQVQKPLALPEPVATTTEIEEMMEKYESLVKKLLDKRPSQRGGDILYINKNGKPTKDPEEAENTHIVRSGLRKLALAMGLDMETISREKIECKDGAGEYYLWRYTVRVTHPGGRTIERDGACTSRDPFFALKGGKRRPAEEIEEPNIMMKAETVAYNRAILDFVGGVKLGTEEAY